MEMTVTLVEEERKELEDLCPKMDEKKKKKKKRRLDQQSWTGETGPTNVETNVVQESEWVVH